MLNPSGKRKTDRKRYKGISWEGVWLCVSVFVLMCMMVKTGSIGPFRVSRVWDITDACRF